MFRMILLPFVLMFVINSELMMTSQLSLGRLFPASRNRQRASSLISHAIESSFFKRPSLQPPKTKSKGTIKSLPSFPDVLWKFNKKLLNNNKIKIQNHSSNSAEAPPDLAEHFSKFSNFASVMTTDGNSIMTTDGNSIMTTDGNSRLKDPRPSDLENEVMAESQRNEVRQKINKINEEEMKTHKQFSTRKSTASPLIKSDKNDVGNKFAGVTNSPIFYIQLPAAPYEFHPSLGYISRPASPDLSSFLRPQIDFLNNGRPTNIYQLATPISNLNSSDVLMTTATTSMTSSPMMELSTTTEKITSATFEESPTLDSSTSDSSSSSSTLSSITDPFSMELTSTSSTTTTEVSTMTEALTSSTTSEFTTTESSTPSSTTLSTETSTKYITTTTTGKPPTPKPAINGGYTNSPITWLKGPYVFNGRPNNLFIYKSPPNKADRFDYLHKLYSKPGVYL